MKFCFKIIFVFAFFLIPTNLLAVENIFNSLAAAYLNNPQLNSERAKAKAVDETLIQSYSVFKPTVIIAGNTGRIDNSGVTGYTSTPTVSSYSQTSRSISIQESFNPGNIYASQSAANAVEVEKNNLKLVEQNVLLSTSQAYLATLLAQESIQVYKENLELAEKQVELNQSKLDKGLSTISDVSQSESALASAQANLLTAQNNLLINKKNFKNIVGYDPVDLSPVEKINLSLPKSLEQAIEITQNNSPVVKIAQFTYEKANTDYKAQMAFLSPTFALSYTDTNYSGYSYSIDKLHQAQAMATVSTPIYQGGKQTSSILQYKAQLDGAELDFKNAKENANLATYTAWSNYELSIKNFELAKAQLKAAEIFYEGTQQQYEAGNKTTLDVITAIQTLLAAKVNYTSVKNSIINSQFSLLSAVGDLTAKNLSLDAQIYDPDGYYKRNWIRHIL